MTLAWKILYVRSRIIYDGTKTSVCGKSRADFFLKTFLSWTLWVFFAWARCVATVYQSHISTSYHIHGFHHIWVLKNWYSKLSGTVHIRLYRSYTTFENYALLSCYTASSGNTTLCVRAQKSAVLTYFAAKAWNHFVTKMLTANNSTYFWLMYCGSFRAFCFQVIYIQHTHTT